MVLLETGAFRLDDPVTELLPELADRRVLRSIEAELDDTVPAKRAITVEDVLTYRLGFGAVMAPPGTYPIQVAEAELDLKTLGPPWPPTPHTPDEWIRRFATLPLLHQPGEEWMYNTGGQVLGVLLERAAGKPLETFLRERLFDPLGMHDTAFSVPPQRRDRFTTSYKPDPETSACSVLDGVDDSWWSTLPAFPNTAGWLVSTIDDFWAFTQMLRSGGVHRGERILSEKSVELMTTDHLTPRAARSEHTLSRRPRLGIRHAGAVRRHDRDDGTRRIRLGRRYRHDVAYQRRARPHDDPVHATGDDVTRTARDLRRFRRRGVPGDRGLTAARRSGHRHHVRGGRHRTGPPRVRRRDPERVVLTGDEARHRLRRRGAVEHLRRLRGGTDVRRHPVRGDRVAVGGRRAPVHLRRLVPEGRGDSHGSTRGAPTVMEADAFDNEPVPH